MTGERMCKKPVLVSDGEVIGLNRVPLNARVFQERWLQEILEKAPDVLPAGHVDSVYSQLVCVAREVEVPSGYIDNLYVSARGYVVLVETKLWKNPEARRQVLGQIIDYATDISHWDYEKLDSVYRDYNDGQSLFSKMVEMKYQSEYDESYFVDVVEKNLEKARFLLMVVGDGIREGTERMAEFLESTSKMPFDLALCELEVYDLGGDTRLVIPQLTTKTKVIERTIWRFEDEKPTTQHEDIHAGEDEARQRKRKLRDAEDWASVTKLVDVDEEQVIEFINDLKELGFSYHVGTSDLTIDCPFERLNKKLGCVWLFGTGTVAGFQPFAYYDFLEKNGYSTAPAEKLFEELRPYLSQNQKNTPYDNPRGYYFIDLKTLAMKKTEILEAFERFKLSF